MRSIWLILVLFSASVSAKELKVDDNLELTHVLSRLVTLHEPITFEEQGYTVFFYGVNFGGYCAENHDCIGKVEPLIITTEIGDEGPVSSLYRLPKMHKWIVENWKQRTDGRQEIQLRSVSYMNERIADGKIENDYILVLSWIKAELIAL